VESPARDQEASAADADPRITATKVPNDREGIRVTIPIDSRFLQPALILPVDDATGSLILKWKDQQYSTLAETLSAVRKDAQAGRLREAGASGGTGPNDSR